MLDQAPDGKPFYLSTLRNKAGMEVSVMDWGATLLSCRVPMKDGSLRETLLGCPSPTDYPQQNVYLGASVGRYANRIANGRLLHNDEVTRLEINSPPHQLHGGPEGFDKRRWHILSQDEQSVLYALDSPEGDQGFPGALQVTAHYQLTEDNRLRIVYQAIVDKLCPVNLTNHAYFNLDSEAGDIRHHQLQIFADSYLPVDSTGVPPAGLRSVTDTSFDFRTAKSIARDFLSDTCQQAVKGYDHAFLLQAKGDLSHPAAKLWSRDGQLEMRVYTTAPALQFYSGNYLEGTPAREQGIYHDHHGLALESQFLPDSPNHPEWPQPDCWLGPGEKYESVTEYQFIAQ
ncbi:galactose-1-epimerase [uncultured Cedecea sp.]|uniref:galactose-1-epimerase n=1 Tax=uncultured Cedecea sp. TaxID=988762 RepID=UPI00262DD492|nr:galactose-1-epimerase [uncultured Cedecea sp.]